MVKDDLLIENEIANQFNSIDEQYQIDSNKELMLNQPDTFRSVNNGSVCHPIGKNFLPSSNTSRFMNGITFTANSDGSVTANGTAIGTAYYNLENASLPAGTYVLSGCPSGCGISTYRIVTKYGNNYQTDVGNGSIPFTLNETTTPTERYIAISSGITVNDLTFYPMIESGSLRSDYDPYEGCLYGLELYDMIESNFITSNYYVNCGIIALFLALIIILVNAPFLFIRKIKGD